MADFAYITALAAFFWVAAKYVSGCKALMESSDE